jgi:hypothetical protein
MALDQIWGILNSNLVVLILGSGIGFLFVKLVWEPFKSRQYILEKREKFRDEVRFRLFSFGERTDDLRFAEVTGGNYASCIDPTYQPWSLHVLVFAGWGRDVLRESSPLIERLKDEDSESAKQALRLLEEKFGGSD